MAVLSYDRDGNCTIREINPDTGVHEVVSTIGDGNLSYKEPKMFTLDDEPGSFDYAVNILKNGEFFLECHRDVAQTVLDALNLQRKKLQEEKDREFVKESVDEASHCWIGQCKCTFDSERAKEVEDSILEYFRGDND